MRKSVIGFALLAAAPVMIAAEPAPPPPPLPNSHHERPATPVIGTYYVGRFGGDCTSGTLSDGRPYRDNVRRLEAGQRIGISLTSPDTAPTLQVLRPDDLEQPLARLGASADGERVTSEFEVAESGDHILRVIAPAAGADGRWRVELAFDRPIESVYFSDFFDWSRADRACR